MATVGGSVFTTTTDPAGNYKLGLYSESDRLLFAQTTHY